MVLRSKNPIFIESFSLIESMLHKEVIVKAGPYEVEGKLIMVNESCRGGLGNLILEGDEGLILVVRWTCIATKEKRNDAESL